MICTICRNQLPITDYNFTTENSVDRIFYGQTPIVKANSFLFYTKFGLVKTLIHQLKYKGRQELGTFFGEWHGQQIIDTKLPMSIDMVIPVPLHSKKLKTRGYNQVTTFGTAVAKTLKVPFQETYLYRKTHTTTQTKKDRFLRWESQEKNFDVHPKYKSKLEGKTILLVDDVLTTGATLTACANALHKIRGVKIYITTIAVAPLH